MKTEKQTLSLRLTRRYNAGHAHLDEWEELGTFRELLHREGKLKNEYRRDFVLLSVSAPGEAGSSYDDDTRIIRAIQDTMNSGCSCDHDCCGHIHTWVSNVRTLKPGKLYAAFVELSRNV